MSGSHEGRRIPWRKRRQHPARILADNLTDAFVEYYGQFTDEELLALDITRAALRRIADESHGGGAA